MRVIPYQVRGPALGRYTNLRLGIARRFSVDDVSGGSSIVPGTPDTEGDNYIFVTLDSSPDAFALKVEGDVSGNNYVLWIVGDAGFEQLEIQPAFANPPMAPIADGLYYEFASDGSFKLVDSAQTYAYMISVYNGQFAIGAQNVGLPAAFVFLSGVNFRFNGTLFQLKDLATGNWYTPWIIDQGGNPILRLEPA